MGDQLYIIDDNKNVWCSGNDKNNIKKTSCFSKIKLPQGIDPCKIVKNYEGTILLLDSNGILWMKGYDPVKNEELKEFKKVNHPLQRDRLGWGGTLMHFSTIYTEIKFVDVDINDEFIMCISTEGELWAQRIGYNQRFLKYEKRNRIDYNKLVKINLKPSNIKLNKIYVEKKFDEIIYIAIDKNGDIYIQLDDITNFITIKKNEKKGKPIKVQAFSRYEKFYSDYDEYTTNIYLVPYIAILTNKGILSILTLKSKDVGQPTYNYPITTQSNFLFPKGFSYLDVQSIYETKNVIEYENINDFSVGFNYLAFNKFNYLLIYGFDYPYYGDNYISLSEASKFNNTIFHRIPGTYDIVRLFCLDQSIFFIDSNKKLWGYGDNSNGQLGLSTKSKYIKQFIDLGLIDSHFNDIASWFISENILDLDNFYELTDI